MNPENGRRRRPVRAQRSTYQGLIVSFTPDRLEENLSGGSFSPFYTSPFPSHSLSPFPSVHFSAARCGSEKITFSIPDYFRNPHQRSCHFPKIRYAALEMKQISAPPLASI